MPPPVTLHGGRYDGMGFVGLNGWVPGEAVGVLYLGRATHEDWEKAIVKEKGTPSTALVTVPFAAHAKHDPFDPSYHSAEVYLRCKDGSYRTPKMAAIL